MDKYLELKTQFEAHKNDENALKMAAYMRNLFSFYGLPTPVRKSIYKELLKSEKSRKEIDWDFLDKCYADEHREFHYFVVDYLGAMQKLLKFADWNCQEMCSQRIPKILDRQESGSVVSQPS